MTLKELPALVVEEITVVSDALRLRGHFTHLKGVRVGSSALYCGDAQWPGELVECDCDTRQAVFIAPLWVQRDRISVGSTVPWLPEGWQYFHVNLVVAPASSWALRRFVASDAQHFRAGNAHGWTKAGARLEPAHELTHIEPGGWDHEECAICFAHIGRGGLPEGYVNDADAWLCQTCYNRYARTHDLDFMFAN